MRHGRGDLFKGENRFAGRQRQALCFCFEVGLYIADGAEVTEFFVFDLNIECFLDEHNDLDHEEGIDAEVFKKARLVGIFPDNGPDVRFDETLDDPQNDDRDGFRIGRFTVLQGGFNRGL